MLTTKLPWWADEEGGFAADPMGGVWGDSVEGIIEGAADGDGGSFVGEEEWLPGAGVGVTDEAGGWTEGDAGGGDDVARVSIWTFIPWLQCPAVPQMKYLLPCEESGMVVVPPE